MPNHDHDYGVDCQDVDQRPSIFKPMPDDLKSFGRLVLTWALDFNSVPIGDQDRLKQILAAASLDVPDDMCVDVVQRDSNRLLIVVPPKDMAEVAICDMEDFDRDENPNRNLLVEYGFPPFYVQFVAGWKDQNNKTRSMLEFYEYRVGDYTMGFCR